MRRHHNPNKVPPFKPDPEHWTRKVHSWKAKVAYETEDDALGVSESESEIEGTRLASLLMQGLFKVAYW